MKKQKEALRRQKEEEERQLKLKKEKSRSTVQSIQQGTFSADFEDDFDEDFASMLGGSRLGGGGGNITSTSVSTPSSGPLGRADESGISTYEMEEDDDTNNDFDFNDDF